MSQHRNKSHFYENIATTTISYAFAISYVLFSNSYEHRWEKWDLNRDLSQPWNIIFDILLNITFYAFRIATVHNRNIFINHIYLITPNSSRTGRSSSSKVSESKIPASIQRIKGHDRRVWIAGKRWNTTSALRWPLRDGNLLRWRRDFARKDSLAFWNGQFKRRAPLYAQIEIEIWKETATM